MDGLGWNGVTNHKQAAKDEVESTMYFSIRHMMTGLRAQLQFGLE